MNEGVFKMIKILLIVTSFLLFSYNYKDKEINITVNVQAEEKKTEISSSVLQTFASILLNKEKFYCTHFDKYIFLNELDSLYFGEEDEYAFTFLKFAIVDFDKDKIPEIVLEMSCGGAEFFEVFRYREGEIYNYQLGNREMQNLQKNGTFISSGGAAYNSLGKLRFLGNYYDIDKQAYSESNLDGNNIGYYLHDEPINEELFTELIYPKDTVEWYDFTEKNVNEKLIDNPDSQWKTLDSITQADIEKQNYLNSLAYLMEFKYYAGDDKEKNSVILECYTAWDKELNKIYQLLSKKLSETEMEQLRIEQRKWITRRDELAQYYYEDWNNDEYFRKDAQFIYHCTLLDITKRRTYYLIDLYFDN